MQIGGGSPIFQQGEKGGPYKFMQLFKDAVIRKIIIKFNFWNLSGYSDLSVEEGTVGGRERICVE